AKKIKGGFNFLEGPVWVSKGGYLLLSDMQNGTGPDNVQPAIMRKFTPPDTFEEFIANSGSNGLAITADETEIIAATQDLQSLSSFSLADKSRSVVVSDYNGAKFNSPNDLTIRSDGTIYFTDPDFQRGNRPDTMGGKTSVFRVTNGKAFLVDDTIGE